MFNGWRELYCTREIISLVVPKTISCLLIQLWTILLLYIILLIKKIYQLFVFYILVFHMFIDVW